jgi:hypothetical protein
VSRKGPSPLPLTVVVGLHLGWQSNVPWAVVLSLKRPIRELWLQEEGTVTRTLPLPSLLHDWQVQIQKAKDDAQPLESGGSCLLGLVCVPPEPWPDLGMGAPQGPVLRRSKPHSRA